MSFFLRNKNLFFLSLSEITIKHSDCVAGKNFNWSQPFLSEVKKTFKQCVKNIVHYQCRCVCCIQWISCYLILIFLNIFNEKKTTLFVCVLMLKLETERERERGWIQVAVHNGQIQARREALHVILGSALVFLGVIGSFKLIGLYRTETVCFRAGLAIFTTLICSFCVYV